MNKQTRSMLKRAWFVFSWPLVLLSIVAIAALALSVWVIDVPLWIITGECYMYSVLNCWLDWVTCSMEGRA